jgi:UDP-N-acetylmuramoyl-L-alanyl-D-glutamate--2,6-diaminopimelate ligase
MKLLAELLASLNGCSVSGPTDIPVSSVDYDSRSCNEFSLYAAVPGSTMPPSDGNQFIEHAISRGATAIVTNLQDIQAPQHVTVITVPDTRDALARISNAYYDYPSRDLRIYGITGTNGKTTCTFLLKSIFEEAGEATGLIGTTGNYIGQEKIAATHTTPEAPQLCKLLSAMVRKGIKNVVMEVSSHALALDRVGGINFAGGLFTNLTHDHLDFHGTMEQYARAKKRMFDLLPREALALAIGDSAYSYFMLSETRAHLKTMIGRSCAFDARINNEEHTLSGSRYTLEFGSTLPKNLHGSMEIISPLVGRFNVENTALCATLAYCLGIDKDIIRNALRTSAGAPGRMQKIRMPNGCLALIDYAHTPDALEKALATCRQLLNETTSGGRLTIVFGCGGERDQFKRPIMGQLAAQYADSIILTDDNPRGEDPEHIITQIKLGIPSEKKQDIQIIPSRADAICQAITRAVKNDIILIAGKGHEEYQIIGNTMHPFSDYGTVLSLIDSHFLQAEKE